MLRALVAPWPVNIIYAPFGIVFRALFDRMQLIRVFICYLSITLTFAIASANLLFIMLNSKAFKLLSTSRLVSRERHWTGDL
jgi:hypothetical protein